MIQITCKNCKEPIRLPTKETDRHISVKDLREYIKENSWIHVTGLFNCLVEGRVWVGSGRYAEPDPEQAAGVLRRAAVYLASTYPGVNDSGDVAAIDTLDCLRFEIEANKVAAKHGYAVVKKEVNSC